MISGNQVLVDKIIRKIESEGPIPFKLFMEMALYDPEEGYYTSSREKIGARGDFYTSPEVHPLFGQMIARQLVQMAEAILITQDHFDCVEAGPGNGVLAFNLLKTLQENHLALFNRMTYFMVESSPGLVRKQKELFNPYPELNSKIEWVPSLNELPPVEGLVFSNELFDAFPVHRVIWKGALQEIFVDYEEGEFIERLMSLSDPALGEYFRTFPVNWIENQEAEVNLNLESWIMEIGQKLKRGFVMTIDYGDLYEELYSIKRRRGTLLCYRDHQTSENPYHWIGAQDMTSHLNFSALQKFGMEKGLIPLGFTEQSRFLMGLGIIEAMDRYLQEIADPTRDPAFRAMKYLIHPEGLGPVFKVLIQQKGIGEVSLEGLKFARKTFQK